MRRTVILLASMALAVMLSAGTALALNVVSCEGGGIRCAGTDRPDLIRGSDDLDAIYGRDGSDTLKGRGEGDALLGHKGDDELLGGARQDLMIGGVGDDTLRGGDALDIYYFERPDWGQDAIRDASPRNLVRLPNGEDFAGAITTTMRSDSGPLPEVSYAEGGSTVDWKGDVVAVVVGSTGDDTVTGNDATSRIFDGEELDTDRDTISAAGGSDLIDVQDGAADDKVTCGGGHDTVYFDEELELVFPEDCEEKNPVPNTLQERRVATFGVGSPEEAPAGALGDE
jgi:Ca2+-binding RTX toxin-like protein